MVLTNNITKYVLITLIGIVSGILQGALGSVGLIVIIPALLVMNIVGDYKTACGTLLFTLLFPTSLLGLNEYYHSNSMAIITGIILTITMTIGGYYGSLVSNYITYGTLELISGIIFIIVGIHYLFMGSHSLYTKEIRNKTIWF
jgi:uncharacterized membrane protein YfcA